MSLREKFHRAAWRQDHWVRTHCMWNFKRSRKEHMNERYASRSLKSHPLYMAAKHEGNHAAAQQIIRDLISLEALQNIKQDLKGRKPKIVVPSLTEFDPNNVIPLAFAHRLAVELDLEIFEDIYELESAGRTGKDGIYRLFAQPRFRASNLPAGEDFMVVDDVCTLGGTIANLVQFIENNGSRVIAISALADGDSSPEAKMRRSNQDFLLNIQKSDIDRIREIYGDDLEKSLKKLAGITYETLTSREASFLINAISPEELKAEILRMENKASTPKSPYRGQKRE